SDRTFTVNDGPSVSDLVFASGLVVKDDVGGGGLIKDGAGRLQFDSTSSSTVLTTIDKGDVQVDGSIVDAVLAGGSLSGKGTVHSVLGASSSGPVGAVAPGDNGASSLTGGNGTLTINGASTLANSTKFSVDLDKASSGAGTGYDQLVVDGVTLNLNDSILTGL